MTVLRSIAASVLILLYVVLFVLQEGRREERILHLDVALPAPVYQVIGGYLKQLLAEMLFIKTSVFVGGLRPGTPEKSYESALIGQCQAMTLTYPRFNDPYFLCQALLPYISREGAEVSTEILRRGIAEFPDNLMFRLYHATNLFRFLDKPLESSAAFKEASKLDGAPPMFARLAYLFSAQGGNIVAALISLRTMAASETDEKTLRRYEEEIAVFEKGLEVQKAVQSYATKFGRFPGTLEELVPVYLEKLPESGTSFRLVYEPPIVKIQRPAKK